MDSDGSLGQQSSAGDWLNLWGSDGGRYNCSTATFDVGCLDCPGANDIRVATSLDKIFTNREEFQNNKCAKESPSQPSEFLFGGVWVTMLTNICKNLNLRCKVYEAVDHGDSVEDSSVLRDLLHNVTDIGMMSIVISNSRIKAGNYSVIPSPVFTEYSMLIHKRFLTVESMSTDKVFLSTYTSRAWITLGLLLLVIGSGLILSQKLRAAAAGQVYEWKKAFLDILMAQITSNFPGHIISIFNILPSTVTLVMVSLFFSLIIQNSFNARIPFELTANGTTIPPFSTIRQFLESDFKVYGTAEIRETLLQSRREDIRELGLRIIPRSSSKNFYEKLGRDPGGKEGHVVRKEIYATIASFTCDFVEAIPVISTSIVSAFWFRRGDYELYSKFNKEFLVAQDTAIITYNVNYYSTQYVRAAFRLLNKTPEECMPHALSKKRKVGKRALRMSDLDFPFIGLAVVGGLGFCLLAVEMVFFRTDAVWSSSNCRLRISPLRK